jgi:hypothetical protein
MYRRRWWMPMLRELTAVLQNCGAEKADNYEKWTMKEHRIIVHQ